MEQYIDGDANAFRELYALVAPKLLGYLMRMTRQRASADDLLQQTFLKVHRARAAYVRGADPVPWIYSIAHRTFIDETRRHRRAVVRVGEAEELPELVTAALDALAELPAQQREAVVLTKLDGKSVAEAAEIAGTTVGAMKVRAHRGYEALRRLLGKAPARRRGGAGGGAGAGAIAGPGRGS